MDLHDLFPMFGIKNHIVRLNFSRTHLTNLFFVYATLMMYNKSHILFCIIDIDGFNNK